MQIPRSTEKNLVAWAPQPLRNTFDGGVSITNFPAEAQPADYSQSWEYRSQRLTATLDPPQVGIRQPSNPLPAFQPAEQDRPTDVVIANQDQATALAEERIQASGSRNACHNTGSAAASAAADLAAHHLSDFWMSASASSRPGEFYEKHKIRKDTSPDNDQNKITLTENKQYNLKFAEERAMAEIHYIKNHECDHAQFTDASAKIHCEISAYHLYMMSRMTKQQAQFQAEKADMHHQIESLTLQLRLLTINPGKPTTLIPGPDSCAAAAPPEPTPGPEPFIKNGQWNTIIGNPFSLNKDSKTPGGTASPTSFIPPPITHSPLWQPAAWQTQQQDDAKERHNDKPRTAYSDIKDKEEQHFISLDPFGSARSNPPQYSAAWTAQTQSSSGYYAASQHQHAAEGNQRQTGESLPYQRPYASASQGPTPCAQQTGGE